ncbi:HAD family phosphatase [Candidatus Parcubacteria bacterium]|nr:HAD family phosphatase [Patescibacteria group bacterium]MBU4466833.1 HAD family phosphatase [Patescibacteria group bacterium]MCG2688784.1 HAD family phosphatase [Candidatus Parcubacteria bacterium]
MVKAVIFDCGNVLHRVENKHIKKDIGLTLAVNIEMVEKLWRKLVPSFGRGEITEKEFWQKFLRQSGSKKPLPKESLFVRELRKRYKAYDDVMKIVYQLKEKGIRLAVLSNTIAPHVKFLTSKSLFRLFDIKIFSNEVGFQKPDKRMYRLALNKLGVQPAETVLIDDEPTHIKAGMKAGVRGILFQSIKQLKRDLIKLGVL